MKSHRIKLLTITAIVFLGALVVTALFVREINSQKRLLTEQVTALLKDQEQQTLLNQTKKLISESESDREQLASYYLQSQSDSIDFLNYIEDLALSVGIALETKSPKEVERGGDTILQVDYVVSGSRLRVDQFTKLLEKIPYLSEVTALSFSKNTAVEWQADVTIEVMILDYETNT